MQKAREKIRPPKGGQNLVKVLAICHLQRKRHRKAVFYEAYISKCCLRPFYDEYGNVYIVVDMELKGRIREALLKMICEFEIDEH